MTDLTIKETDPVLYNHWKLLKFFLNETMEIGSQHDFVEGSTIVSGTIEQLSEKMVERYL